MTEPVTTTTSSVVVLLRPVDKAVVFASLHPALQERLIISKRRQRPGKTICSNAQRASSALFAKAFSSDKVLGRAEIYLQHKVVRTIGELKVLPYRMMKGMRRGKTDVLFLLWRGVSERPCLL
jgi:hypothetical protein